MSRAIRPLTNRVFSFRNFCRSSIALNSRACSSLPGTENVVVSPPVMRAPAWAEWNSGMELPEESGSVDGELELMAVPKRKVTPSRRGKRNNGNWKLKSVPVIAKCKGLLDESIERGCLQCNCEELLVNSEDEILELFSVIKW